MSSAATIALHFVLGELVTLVVDAVAQRGVRHPDVPHRVEVDVVDAHAWRSFRDDRQHDSLAISSPTLVAAAVMMSRFPA